MNPTIYGGQGLSILDRLQKNVERFLDIIDKLGINIEADMASKDIKRRDQTRQVEVYGRSITAMLGEARAFMALNQKAPKLDDAAAEAELKMLIKEALKTMSDAEIKALRES